MTLRRTRLPPVTQRSHPTHPHPHSPPHSLQSILDVSVPIRLDQDAISVSTPGQDAASAGLDSHSSNTSNSTSSLSATENGALMSTHMARVHQTPPSPRTSISDISGVSPSSSYPTYVHSDGNNHLSTPHHHRSAISASSSPSSSSLAAPTPAPAFSPSSSTSIANSSVSTSILSSPPLAASSASTTTTTTTATAATIKQLTSSQPSASLRRHREEVEDDDIQLDDLDRKTFDMEMNISVSSISGTTIAVGMLQVERHSINRPNKRPRLVENEDTEMRSLSPPVETTNVVQQPQPVPGKGKLMDGSSSITSTSSTPAPIKAYPPGPDARTLLASGSSNINNNNNNNSSSTTSTPPVPSSSSASTSNKISRDVSMSSPLPGRSSLPPLPHTPTHHPHTNSYSHQHHGYEEGDLVLSIGSGGNSNSNPPGTDSGVLSFKVHAGRLVIASRAFASLLTTPISSPAVFSGPGGPKASARAAAEIGAKLARRRRSNSPNDGDGMMTEEEVQSEIEYVDQCPLVRLEGDSPKDWSVALEAIYEPMSFQIRPVIFEALAGVLRIATKYEFTRLREWAVTQLRTTWPSSLDHMAPLALPHAADAIALARQCNVPEILPAAFYALAVQRWRPSPSRPCSFSGSPNQASNSRNFASGTDGGRAHAVLDPMDLRRLVMGREALQDVLVEFVAAPLSVSPCMLPEDETSGNGTMIISEKGSSYWSSGTESKEVNVTSGSGSEKSREVNGKHVYPPSPSPSPTPSRKSSSNLTTSSASSGSGSGGKTPTVNMSPATPATSPVLETFPNSSGRSTESPTLPLKPASSSSSIPNFTFCPSTGPGASSCRNALEALWRARLTPDPRRAWGTWLIRELHRLATLPRAAAFCTVVADSSTSDSKFPDNESGGGYGLNGNGCGGYSEYSGGAIGECQYQYQRYQYQQWKVDDGSGPGTGINTENGGCPVCKRCWEENQKLVLWRLDWLCASIPGMFML